MNLFDLAGNGGATPQPPAAVCSRKACRAGAEWQLLWNNPKIHTPERRKIWLACGEHRAWLEDYLQTRGLWKETLPLRRPRTTRPRPSTRQAGSAECTASSSPASGWGTCCWPPFSPPAALVLGRWQMDRRAETLAEINRVVSQLLGHPGVLRQVRDQFIRLDTGSVSGPRWS